MQPEGSANPLDPQSMSAWTLVAEMLFAGPFVEEAIERAVAVLVPAGPWMSLLRRSLTDRVMTAILYMQHKRGTHLVHLQCYQFHSDAELPRAASGATPEWAPCGSVPPARCGWSFFLIEKCSAASACPTPPDPCAQPDSGPQSEQAVVQIYLFNA